ncbi:MAG: peptidylprolyl isomerase [Roseomonas sp.]|nr:peptidylprolyl isomerase [Roseomonas sp.]
MRHSRGPAASAPLRATLALLLGVTLAQPGLAQPAPAAPPTDPVVAKVDGEEIRFSDLANAAQELPEELRGAPPQMLYPLLLDQMIAGRAVAAAARRAGLDKDEAVRARIRRAEEQELQQAYLSRELAGRVTEERIRAAYDAEIRARPAEEEIRARHILVPTETEAREALAEIRAGADFNAVAQRRSAGPGAREGGDLGFFKRGDMVPEFAEAAFALPAGQTSAAPVRSPFGWHIIRVDERRASAPPSFEEAREALRQRLFEAEINTLVERARATAKIERFNLDGSTPRAIDAAEPPTPAAPAGRPAAPTRR